MPLVQAKCTQCGASLKVNNEASTALCPFCKMEYVVQDAINNYVTNNYTHIGTLNAEHVTVNDDRSAEQRLQAAEAFLTLREYDKADKAFQEVCELTPQDYRGWWGRLRVYTREFTSNSHEDTDITQLKSLFERTVTFAPSEQVTQIKKQYDNYYSNLVSRNWCDKENEIKQLKLEISTVQKDLERTRKEFSVAKTKKEQLEQAEKETEEKLKKSFDRHYKKYYAKNSPLDYERGYISLLIVGVGLMIFFKVFSWFSIASTCIGGLWLLYGLIWNSNEKSLENKIDQLRSKGKQLRDEIYAVSKEMQRLANTIHSLEARENALQDRILTLQSAVKR